MTQKISDLIMQIEIDLQIVRDALSYESNPYLAQLKMQKVLDRSAILSNLLSQTSNEISS